MPATGPGKWEVHHMLQVDRPDRILEGRFKLAGINIHKMEYLRGVPASVHDEIDLVQRAWWKQVAKEEFGGNIPLAKQNIKLDRVIKFAKDIELKYASRWIEYGPMQAARVNRIKHMLKNSAVAWGMGKGARWQSLGLRALAALPILTVLGQNAEAAYKIKNFDPDTHIPFKRFMGQYEATLDQAIDLGRVKKKTGEVLTRNFADFAKSIALDPEAVDKVKTAMDAWTDLELHE